MSRRLPLAAAALVRWRLADLADWGVDEASRKPERERKRVRHDERTVDVYAV